MTAIEQLAAEALADDKKATPGPWDRVDEIVCADDGNSIAECFASGGPRMTNAACIAASRTREPILAAWVAKVAPELQRFARAYDRRDEECSEFECCMADLVEMIKESK